MSQAASHLCCCGGDSVVLGIVPPTPHPPTPRVSLDLGPRQ